MGIASAVHLYVFPAEPYALLANQSPGNISVLGDCASSDPVDPFEITESNRPTKMKFPQLEPDERNVTNIKESVRDFVVGSGEYVSSPYSFFLSTADNFSIYMLGWALSFLNQRNKSYTFYSQYILEYTSWVIWLTAYFC